ncbi:MAG: SusC/RagA family TonB-linked outer membrane protein [Saprospiraceae bacterium]|nr:SusC/RagA family TonB-linked outer membrane protein [Saprospiraceae bacterium]
MKNNYLTLLIMLLSIQFMTAQRTVLGIVTDADSGESLIGANVLVSGTTLGTITDIDGSFTIEVTDEASELVVSFTGYNTQRISIAGGITTVNISLQEGSLLDEVVVTGYVTEKKKDLLGAVGILDVDDIAEVSNPNVLQSMQGRVAGVNVDLSGDPGQGTRVRIRGISTLGNNDPLYIVDGVPIQSFQTDEVGTGNSQVFGLSWLNPNDIESVQVLKDASSASIYGSRASNGVVIITTKQPEKNKSKISVNLRTTSENWNSFDDLTNNEERARLEWQGAVNDGADPDATGIYTYEWHLDPSLGAGIQGNGVPVLDRIIYPEWLDESDQLRPSGFGGNIEEGTDWWDEVSQAGLAQNYDITFSQGGDNGGVVFGANYFDHKGVVIETAYQRIGLRLNSNYSFLNNRITVGENLAVVSGKRQLLDSGFGGTSEQGPYRIKTILPVRTEDGRFAGPPGGGFSDRDNPVALAFDNRDDELNNVKLFGNVFANFEIIEGLNLRTSFGIDQDNFKTRDIFRTYSRGFLGNTTAELLLRNSTYSNWVFNNTLTYTKELGEHSFTALAGTEAIESKIDIFSASGKDFAQETEAYFQLSAASGERSSDGFSTGFSLFSYFGKVNYAFKGKYLASATIRRDGSSRFGLNNRYAVFPAFSVGWRISDEDFLKDGPLNNLKLRAAWGKSGNQSIENEARFSLYQAVYAPQTNILPWGGGCAEVVCPDAATSYDIGNNDGGILPSGFTSTQTGNDDLKWETTTELNLGIDFGFNEDQIVGTFEVFNKSTEDILVQPRQIAAFGDGARRFVNGADVETKGWELAVQYNSPIRKDFDFGVGLNLSHYSAKITNLPEDLYPTFPGNAEQNIIGQHPSTYFGYRTDGLFQSQAEVDGHAEQVGARVGALKYIDLNNDGVISALDQEYGDVANLGDLQFGINLQANYKNFDLALFGWGELGRSVAPDVFRMELGTLSNGENGGVNQLNAWSFTNTDSHIPAVSNSVQPLGFSLDYHVRNGNFFALRQLTIGYTVPQSAGISDVFSNLRFYVTGENLGWLVDRSGSNQYTSTGWSIENRVNAQYPKPMRISFGINASF